MDIEEFPNLLPFFEAGAFAANVHSASVIHGDLKLSKLIYADQRNIKPLGERVITVDLGHATKLDRPITTSERAKDLATLKTSCTYIRWEAVKLGYRFKAPEEAEKVFKLI